MATLTVVSDRGDDPSVLADEREAMDDFARRELISLADDEGNSVTVNVLRRNPSWAAGLDAEIVVGTSFVSGRCYLALSVSKLESWSDALNRLDAGEDIAWMELGRGASIAIQLTGERDCPEVFVADESGSMVTVRVPIALPDDWIADHRQRLHQAMEYWVPRLGGDRSLGCSWGGVRGVELFRAGCGRLPGR
ncbi:DUF5959 family protein [Streptomyces sp. NPDC127072]|uniref:DUF5959 family protein n=1 Tax=Streptomyces sp. NPDC127072 TaxID=3347129 RepID=UPI0036486050